MKKILKATTVLLGLLILFSATASANSDRVYSWYCKRNKEHKQPILDGNIEFVKQNGGVYVDQAHGDDVNEKVVYFTFDAGYENGNIAKILDIMKVENVKGAFFVLGHLIEKNTDLVYRMINEGHLVCNHSYSHKDASKLNREQFEEELKRLEAVCFEKTGREIDKYYRPPEGRFSEKSLKFAHAMGYRTVFWSFAYADWDNQHQPSPTEAKEKILSNIHNGAILLLHPTSKTNVEILQEVIRELKAQGYRFGMLNEITD